MRSHDAPELHTWKDKHQGKFQTPRGPRALHLPASDGRGDTWGQRHLEEEARAGPGQLRADPAATVRARRSPIDPHDSLMKTWPGQARSPDDPIFALLLGLLRATTSVTSEDVGEPRWLREGLGRELARRIF